MGLMRRLRDRQAIVDGDTIVETEGLSLASGASTIVSAGGWQDEFSASVSSIDKGKGRAVENPPLPSTTSYNVAPGFYDSIAARGINPSLYSGVLAQEMQGATAVSATQQHEDTLAKYFDDLGLEDEEEPVILGKDYLLNNDAMNGAERYAELGRMQAEWDAMDAAESASKTASASASGYQFQSNNPYMTSSAMDNTLHAAHPALPYQVLYPF